MIDPRSLENRLEEIERQLRDLSSGAQMPRTSVGSGGLRVHSDGKITIEDTAGDVLVEFDADGVDIFEADGSILVALTGTGIRVNDGAGTKLLDLTSAGLKAYEGDGSELIVVDDTGVRLNDAAGSKLIDLTTSGLKAYSGANLLVQVNASGVTIFEADGSTLAVLDGTKLRFNRSDGSRSLEITPGGGLKIYATNGTTEQVVLDGDGLEVFGGMVTPIEVVDAQDDAVDASLTTTFQTVAQVSLTFASWVQVASLFVSSFGRMSESVNKNLHIQLLDDAGAVIAGPVIETVPGGEVAGGATGSVSLGASYEETVTGVVDVTLQARVNSGTSATNSFGLTVLALGLRSP